jgi:hypothetical protein
VRSRGPVIFCSDAMVVSSDLTPERIRAAVKRIQSGAGLSGSPTLRQLLEHTVELTLNGHAAEIKESTLAIEVFGRKTSFDPRSDPIVRVQARKLRDRLGAWYETDGAQDDVVIEYVRGSYVPRFRFRSSESIRHRSVAVLPFTNLSDSAALDYVCDGIAEELRYVLSRDHGIRVVAHACIVCVTQKAHRGYSGNWSTVECRLCYQGNGKVI